MEELMVELRSKGAAIPPEIVDDLRSARTLTAIYRRDPTALSIEAELASYMAKVEPILLYLAESGIGKEHADSWQMKINDARTETRAGPAQAPRFVLGVSKGDHWIRIKVADLLSEGDLKEMLERLNLSAKPQEDGYLLVYGDEGNVKTLVREIRKKIGGGKTE
jgi:hypothetical protein